MKYRNLDLYAAEVGQEIVRQTLNQKKNEVENLVNKTLGVLQENGVYAATLFLYSRTSKDETVARAIRRELLQFLGKLGLGPPEGHLLEQADGALRFLTDKVCNDLDTLLLVKQLWEQALIYARYGAKARV